MPDRRCVTVELLGHKGDGVATIDGEAYYLPQTLPGERVLVQRRGKSDWVVESVKTPSPARSTSLCRHFGRCGGCALQHMAQPEYLTWKTEILRSTLAQRGFDHVKIDKIFQIPPHARRRVVLSAVKTASKTVLGFQQRKSHQIEDVSECPVAVEEIEHTLDAVREMLAIALRVRQTARVTINATQSGCDVLITSQGVPELDGKTAGVLAGRAAQHKLARLTWGDDLIYQREPPRIAIRSYDVSPPPGGFLQASEEAQDFLIDRVIERANNAQQAVDLFCGLGTFALPLASACKVRAFDADRYLIDALTTAAKKAGLADRITSEARDLYRRPLQAQELRAIDLVILDPPRAGAKAQIEQLAISSVSRVIYVSCNPATFARDARILVNEGFHLDTVHPVDQFLWSPHTELIAELYR